MQVAELARLVRFHVFPYVPAEQKHKVVRMLFEMDVGHPEFQKFIVPHLQGEQFVGFYKTLKYWKKTGEFRKLLHPSLDLELIEQLFWEEQDEKMAQRLLAGLLGISRTTHISLWNSAVNLWLSAASLKDKEHTLTFIDMILFSG